MAAVAPAADQATGLLQKLSIDSKLKNNDVSEVAKKPGGIQYGTVGNDEASTTPVPSSDRSTTPVLPDFMDPNMFYGYTSPAYYYGVNEWDDYSRYVSPDGMDMPPHGMYGDMYHGYGYAPYGAYPPGSHVSTMGQDGHLYGPQQYQYPGSYYQPNAPITSTTQTPPVKIPTSQSEVSTTVAADQPPPSVDLVKANSNGITNANGNSGSVPPKTGQKNSSLMSNGTYGRGGPPSGLPSAYQDPRFSYDGIHSPVPWLDAPVFPDAHYRLPTSNISSNVSNANNLSLSRNQNIHPLPHPMGSHPRVPAPAGPGFINRMYPNSRLFGQCGNALQAGQVFGSNAFDFRANGHGWMTMDGKYKVRGRGNGFYGYGNENIEGLNELNRGPRSGRFKNNQKNLGPNVVIAVKGQNLPSFAHKEDSCLIPDRDQYNKAEFPEAYSDAKFFVIKSYSEDDIHKSVKYDAWASTPNGNKKLDAAYREAQEKDGGCPVFLFFSVNTSGQFVGVAEMVGPVDFNKTVDYWQQDKWNGCFPVKWHIVKDVPNSILKHITLENNENKPVTNSRDTQEIKLEQGIQMVKLFKEHVSKTSILDDFPFYETRQKTMQEKRAKQQFQKQAWDGKVAPVVSDERDGANAKPRLPKPLESSVSENGIVAVPGNVPNVVKPVLEKAVGNGVVTNVVANGATAVAANGC